MRWLTKTEESGGLMGQHQIRVLVVDDEPVIRDLANRAISARSMLCDVAADGSEGLALYDINHYDVVVTDLRMPRRHGHAFACELLAKSKPPRIIVLTGLDEPRLLQDLKTRGIAEAYCKPIDFRVLAERVEAIAGRSTGPSIKDPMMQLREIETALKELTELFADRLANAFPGNSRDLPDPPPAIKEFINRAADVERDQSTSHIIHMSRRSERAIANLIAVAVPVDAGFRVVGDAFKLTVRDLSLGGARLLHSRTVPSDYLALDWTAQTLPYLQLRVVVRVTRCRPLARFYDIGGEFVMAD